MAHSHSSEDPGAFVPWRPELSPPATRSAPQPGSRLRSVVLEHATIGASYMVAAVCFAIFGLALHSGDIFDLLSGIVIVGIFGGLGLAVRSSADLDRRERYRRPQPWPAGTTQENPRRTIATSVLTCSITLGAIAALIALFGGDDSLAFYGVISGVIGLSSIGTARRLRRLEDVLGVTLHRELATPPRPLFRPQIFAFVDDASRADR